LDKKNTLEDYTILIAGHDEKDRKIILDIIKDKFKTILADTEEEVLQLLQDSSKNISGAIFSETKAKSFLEEIRVVPALEEFPVLVSFNDSNHELENELIELDVIDFLKAPFSERRTLNRLKTLVKLSNANHLIYELERDELTTLYTRQAFLRKAEEIRSQNMHKKFCVMAFDFDNFKSSNTLYGEEKCNEFLAYTGKRLKGVMPKGIAGRFGGDQYVLFFAFEGDSINVDRLKDLTSSILASAPIPHQVVKTGVNAPIDNNQSMVVCCDRTFLAIREIKGIYGKNLAFYEKKMQMQLLDEQHIIETMEQSLQNEEFKVFYQPKHETITGKIVGAEALVRWEHSECGFMSPNQFIPIFEKNGFISKLDAYMLEHVCQDLGRWEKEGIPVVPVSVNISRHDFMEAGYIDSLIKLVDDYHIDHSLIHMEVTESLYSENTDFIIDQVKKIQELGFMIEMDDFGSGYSSLGLLSSFPLNILKLDITFVRNLKANEIVIENIIKMAHRMGLLTVAEGAETNEQVATLKTLGCDFIQGYYYSKPLPVNDFEKYLNKAKHQKKRIKLQELQGENSSDDDDWHMNENMLIAANEVAEGMPGGFFS
jgi:diguanylate cyclase (GGDEF)-like protein